MKDPDGGMIADGRVIPKAKYPMLYNWDEDETLKAAKERMKTYPVAEQGRLQAISDWIWEYESHVDTTWRHMPPIWKEAYIKSFNECMETEKRERDNGSGTI